jgi:DNA-binding transcriptional LysR family regulator
MELALQRVAILPVEQFPIMRHWYIVYRQGKRLSPAARAFRDFVLNDAKALWPLA